MGTELIKAGFYLTILVIVGIPLVMVGIAIATLIPPIVWMGAGMLLGLLLISAYN